MWPLTTPRLRLRPFTGDDAAAVLEIHQHPDLRRFIPSAACDTLDDARDRIARFATYADDPVLGFAALEARDGAVVGLVMLKPIPPSERGLAPTSLPEPGEEWAVEIGWRGHPAHAGRGYVGEAARAVLAHAFDNGLRHVVAVTHPDNHASQRVAERAGMRRAGLTRAFYDEECLLFESGPAVAAAF